MSPTVTRAIRNAALALGLVAAGTGIALVWRRYGGMDPYASLEKPKRVSDPNRTVVAKNVKVRHYKDGKLVASLDAAGMNVSKDRGTLDLQKIRNGKLQTPNATMQFAAGQGLLHPNLKSVDLSSGVRVKGTDFDINTQQANLNGRIGQLNVPTPLTGTLGGGAFSANTLTHRPGTDFTKLTAVRWGGKLPKGAPVPDAVQGRVWDMACDDYEKRGANVVYINARAQDDELIVMAPKVVQDTKTDVLTATGRATYRSAKADIVADKIVIYRKEHKAVCTGNVVALVRAKKEWNKPLSAVGDPLAGQPLAPPMPKGAKTEGAIPAEEKQRDDELRSGKTLRDYPMNVKAEEVTYWYQEGERRAIARGGEPTAFQRFDDGRWRETKAIRANYDGEKDLLDLYSEGGARQVKMTNSIGDVVNAVWLQLSTKENESEDDEYMKSKGATVHTVDRDASNDPRGGKKDDPKPANPPAKTGEPKTDPSKGTPPPVKTEP